jgi:hypothetical protein
MNQYFPFGDPDGARAELIDIMDGFVGFSGKAGWGGIATDSDDRSVRVIVGKKGAGKTIYLRRLQVSTRSEDSVFSQSIQSDAPSTSQVLSFCEICQGEQVTEKWRELWTAAILASVLSHLLFKKFFKDHVGKKNREEMRKKFSILLPDTSAPHSAYSMINYYISQISTSSRYEEFMNRSIWVELKQELSHILKDSPPIFFYLDAVDEEFAHAPMEWHQCQKGLFYSVMRMLREQGTLGGRLHVTICIRDIVFSSVLRSEHAGRYRNAPHICKLNWDTTRITHFLVRKIEMLDSIYFDDPKKPKTIENFLSMKTISNKSRDIEEDLLSYIVRHTRFLPRDIVEVGNDLARAKLTLKATSRFDQESWQEVIRRYIARNSRTFGDEQLTICANQLASHDRPERSARHGYDEFYTAGKEYIASRATFLKDVIAMIGTEVFSVSDLMQTRQAIEAELPENVDVFSIFWQNGLLGCKLNSADMGFRFFSLEDRDDFLLPVDAVNFAFHSSLIDCVTLKISSKTPVIEGQII